MLQTPSSDIFVIQARRPASRRVVVIGAGPAGLTAAKTLMDRAPGMKPIVLEAADEIGGISRTAMYKGYRFDIGGHRFFSKVAEVNKFWHEVLGDDLIRVHRMSRIFYRGRFFDYPIKLFNVLFNLGIYESARVMLSYVKWRARPAPTEDSMETWVMNRFGGRLYMHFFRSYTEKVWGIPAKEIRADWAAQRIKSLTLGRAIWNAITARGNDTSLIDEFGYPRLGPGMMWERVRDLVVAAGGTVRTKSAVTRLVHNQSAIRSIVSIEHSADGSEKTSVINVDHVISSMPITTLVAAMDPPAPDHVREAAAKLRYRDFLIVTLILNHPDPFPDNWIYIHSPQVKVGRIQNFRAWSAEMVPDPNHASIGMEYFCQRDDGLWSMDNKDLIDLASKELAAIGLAPVSAVIDGTVIRQPAAYPVYDAEYMENLEILKNWLGTFENLQTIGRNGMHRYNNQDHSMLTGMFAARNVLGEKLDLWDVNTERSYHEEFTVSDAKRSEAA